MTSIVTNTAANTAQRFLKISGNNASSSIAKLSSGTRIVRAADDAASLAVSNKLRVDLAGLRQGAANASQGASLVQVATGALERVADILARQKTLATQAVNGVLSDAERTLANNEFTELSAQVTAIAAQTVVNNQAIIGANAGNFTFQVGINAGFNIVVTTTAVTAVGGGIDTAANAVTAQGAIETSLTAINTQLATLGAQQSRLQFIEQNLASTIENLDAAVGVFRDVDFAAETTRLTSQQTLIQAGVSALSQANQIPQLLTRLLQ